MSVTRSTSTTIDPPAPAGGGALDGADRRRAVPVLVLCLVGSAASVADAVSGGADLALVGLAVMVSALSVVLLQARSARVGRPERTSRRAAAAGAAAGLFVAAFLACVGVLERMGPQVTDSAAFAAGVAVMSVVLLVVLPLSLVVFGWCVWRDRRLERWVRVLPWTSVACLAVAAVAVAVADGRAELWLQAAAVAAAGALLTACSAGMSRPGRLP